MFQKKLFLAFLAYFIPSFVIAVFWHLIIFESYYDALKIYREEIIVPFGMVSMILQGLFFGWAYPKIFNNLSWQAGALRAFIYFGFVGFSYTVLPVAAKFPMTSVTDFVIIEAAFNALQFAVYAPLIAWIWRK